MNKLNMNTITEKFQKRFDQAEKNIVSLTNKAENASEDMKNKINNRVNTIRKKQMEAKKQLDEIKESSESAWSKLQKGVSHSLDSLEVAIQQAKGEFE
jgi:ElaB/YqjD/DUF883 family membrane-anchored ribosome-binding protein